MLSYLFLVLGFVILIKGAGFLVDGASSAARRLKVSDLVIGLTVVAFGTSAPELFVNVASSYRKAADIAIGNILGSNIANILLILGVSSVIHRLTVEKGTVWKEIPLSLLAAVVLGIAANDRLIDQAPGSALTRSDGLVFLGFFIIFMSYSFSIARHPSGSGYQVPHKEYRLVSALSLVVAGLACLVLGGRWIVDSAVEIALRWGMSQSLVGLTIVAVGTSLPELATSAVAAYRRNAEIAVGNVVGSNIFNIFFVLGISSVINPLPFQQSSNTDIGMVVLANLFLFLCMFTGKRRVLERWEGLVFLGVYAAYIAFLFFRG